MLDRGEAVLLDVAALIADGAGDSARAALLELSDDRHRDGSVDDRLARLFAMGMLIRLDGDASRGGNPYLVAIDVGPGEMIAAFDVLVSSTPFIRFGYGAANAAIADALIGRASPHVVDFGIGMGTQWVALLDVLGTAGTTSLRLTGVDLPAPGPDPDVRLREVGDRLEEVASHHGITLTYRGIAAPMEQVDLDALSAPNDTLALNLAFALHHVGTDDGVRDAFLHRLRALRPAVVALVEPDSEHNALEFPERVREALAHYGAVFDALNQLVPSDQPARRVLEDEFFGREILNVVGYEGRERVERHERHGAWHRRLSRCGFEPRDLTPFATAIVDEANLPEAAAVEVDAGMLVLTWDGTPLVSASAWRS